MAIAVIFVTSCSDDDDSSGGGGNYYYGSVTATLPSGEDYIAGGAEGDILKGKKFSESGFGGYKWTFSNDGIVRKVSAQVQEGEDGSIKGPLMDEYGYEYRYTLSSDKSKIYLQLLRTLNTFNNPHEERDEYSARSTLRDLRWYTYSEIIARGWWSGDFGWGLYNQIRPYELTVTKTDNEITVLTLTGICEEGFSLVDGYFSGSFSYGNYDDDYQVYIGCGYVSIGTRDESENYDTELVGPFTEDVFTIMGWVEDDEENINPSGTTISVPYTTSGSSKTDDAKVTFTFKGKEYNVPYSNSRENITLNKASE